mmetsp:Transcript_27682/g.49409  ORF Transcript_27682/g.49409 Transcript_27682/m.49409 type:complete len:92 (-) Transcript_27682:41-316(-)
MDSLESYSLIPSGLSPSHVPPLSFSFGSRTSFKTGRDDMQMNEWRAQMVLKLSPESSVVGVSAGGVWFHSAHIESGISVSSEAASMCSSDS